MSEIRTDYSNIHFKANGKLKLLIIAGTRPEIIRPAALLILGDTNSCLSAIAAKRLHIPIFHMEAGNRCKDECLPEETNRRIVDIISDVNLAYSEHARKYLHECGLPKERVYVTGILSRRYVSGQAPSALRRWTRPALSLPASMK